MQEELQMLENTERWVAVEHLAGFDFVKHSRENLLARGIPLGKKLSRTNLFSYVRFLISLSIVSVLRQES